MHVSCDQTQPSRQGEQKEVLLKLRKCLGSLGPLTSQVEEGRRRSSGLRDCGLEDSVCLESPV